MYVYKQMHKKGTERIKEDTQKYNSASEKWGRDREVDVVKKDFNLLFFADVVCIYMLDCIALLYILHRFYNKILYL